RAVCDGGIAQVLEAVKRIQFELEIPPEISLRILRQTFLREINAQRRQARDEQHHRDEQLDAEATNAWGPTVGGQAHGRLTCKVAPSFRSTGCSRVVLLLTQALIVKCPAGRFVN